MASKINLYLSACFFIIASAWAACPVPNTVIDPRTYFMPDYTGMWYTQGIFDQLSNPSDIPACAVTFYMVDFCGPTCIDENSLKVYKKLKAPCANDTVGTHKAKLVRDPVTGYHTIYTLNSENEVVGDSPCYIIAGNPEVYHIAYCCKELSEDTNLEGLFYYSKSSKPTPNLAMKMHKLTKRAGLAEVASKITFLLPDSCQIF